MKQLLENFMNDVINGKMISNPIDNKDFPDIDSTNHGLIYNEFSLQHSLGTHIKNQLGVGYRVEFERHAEKCFGIKTKVKHEIDIVVYNENERKCAIELKFPRNGQYPEQMFSFVKDIAFLEELKSSPQNEKAFEQAYAITLVDDKNFYKIVSTESHNYIYKHFRGNTPAKLAATKYGKPTGKKKMTVTLNHDYDILWQKSPHCELAYYIIDVR